MSNHISPLSVTRVRAWLRCTRRHVGVALVMIVGVLVVIRLHETAPAAPMAFTGQTSATIAIPGTLGGHLLPRLRLEMLDPLGTSLETPFTVVTQNGGTYLSLQDMLPAHPGAHTYAVILPVQDRLSERARRARGRIGEQTENEIIASGTLLLGTTIINPDRAQYLKGEIAEVHVIELGAQGELLCEEQLSVPITASHQTVRGRECAGDNTPHALSITEERPIDIRRIAPSRLHGGAREEMRMQLTFREDFTGTVTESVPEGVAITNISGNGAALRDAPPCHGEEPRRGVSNHTGGAPQCDTIITWPVEVKAGETISLSYTFQIPDHEEVQLFAFGPLAMSEGTSPTDDAPADDGTSTWASDQRGANNTNAEDETKGKDKAKHTDWIPQPGFIGIPPTASASSASSASSAPANAAASSAAAQGEASNASSAPANAAASSASSVGGQAFRTPGALERLVRWFFPSPIAHAETPQKLGHAGSHSSARSSRSAIRAPRTFTEPRRWYVVSHPSPIDLLEPLAETGTLALSFGGKRLTLTPKKDVFELKENAVFTLVESSEGAPPDEQIFEAIATEADLQQIVLTELIEDAAVEIAETVTVDPVGNAMLRQAVGTARTDILQQTVQATVIEDWELQENIVETIKDELEVVEVLENIVTDPVRKEAIRAVVASGSVATVIEETHPGERDKAAKIIATKVKERPDLGKKIAEKIEERKGVIPSVVEERPASPRDASTTLSMTRGGTQGDMPLITVQLKGRNGQTFTPKFHFETGSVLLALEPERRFTPGLYTLEVTVTNPVSGKVHVLTEEFAWGVLAMNPDQDRYRPGETAKIAIGVLDDLGEIVCDAELTVTVTAPHPNPLPVGEGETTTLSTTDGSIQKTGTCGIKDSTLISPDYKAAFTFTEPGTYELTLQATTANGVRSIESEILVDAAPPVIIHRNAATRLYPVGPSPMTIEVEFFEDFTGEIVDTVPEGFIVSDISGNGTFNRVILRCNAKSLNDASRLAEPVLSAVEGLAPQHDTETHCLEGRAQRSSDTIENTITWPIFAKAGETVTLHYIYDAPDVSPEFYLVGPLELRSSLPLSRGRARERVSSSSSSQPSQNNPLPNPLPSKGEGVMQELRSWQIANDAVSSPQTTDDSLVGYWKFDEAGGTTANDASGHGNNGTLTNGPTISTTVAPTNFNNARSLSFDGTDDYVGVTRSSSIEPANSITVSAWVKTATNNKVVLDKMEIDGQQDSYQFYVNPSNKVRLTIGRTLVTGAVSITDNNWHFLTGTYDGNTVRLYVDGVADGSTTRTGVIAYGAFDLIIGKNGGSAGGFFWNGLIDDVRIYNRALSAREISDLASGKHPTVYWDGSASTSFHNGANWDTGAVPDPYTSLVFSGSTNIATLTGAIQVGGIRVNTGVTIDFHGTGVTLLDSGSVINYGTIRMLGNETLTNWKPSGTHGTTLVYGTGTLTSLPTSSFYNLTLNDGLVGYWKLDDTTGTRAADSSGYGNSGSLVNGPTISTTVAPTNYRNARSVSFDGTDDYVVNDTADFRSGDTAGTIAAWIKLDTTNTYNNLFASADYASAIRYLGILTRIDGKLAVVQWNANGTEDDHVYGNTVLSTATWYHVAVTSDGSSYAMYVNGAAETLTVLTGTNSGDWFADTDGRDNWTIGALKYNNTTTNYYNGLIDDVRIYNRALSAGEIAALAAGNHPSTTLGVTTLNANLAVAGDLTLNGGTLDVSTSNYAVTVSGSFLNNGGVFTPRKGTVTLDGGTSGKEILTGGQRFNNLTVNGTSGVWNTRDRLTASGTLTITNGTLDASGSYAIHAGTWTQNGGTFTPRSGTVVLTNAGASTLTPSSSFNTLRIEDPTENGLVGYWKFDEGTNTGSILDSSGYGNTGTRRGGAGVVWTGATVSGFSSLQYDNPSVMEFDGTDDYVDLGQPASLKHGSNDFTYAAWVRFNTAGQTDLIIADSNNSDAERYIYKTAADKATFFCRDTGNNSVSAVGTTTLSTGVWYHIAGVRSGTTGYVYLNGVQEASATNASLGSCDTSPAANINIGRRAGGPGLYWDGLIDDVRIYNRALSASEIANLAKGGYADGTSGTATVSLGAALSAQETLAIDSGILNANGKVVFADAVDMPRGGGTYQTSTATQTFNRLTQSGGTVTGSTGTVDINGTFTQSGGTFTAPSLLTVSGSMLHHAGSFVHGSNTVRLDGSACDTGAPCTLNVTGSMGTLQLDSGLVGYWKFDDGSGSTIARDSSRHVNNGTLVNYTGVQTQTGWVNTTHQSQFFNPSALKFDGVNDYVKVSDAASLNLTTNFSVVGWVQLDTLGSFRALYGAGTNTNHWRVGVSNNNKLVLTEDAIADFEGTSTLSTGTWYHIAFVKRSDSGNNLTFYLNGSADGTAAIGSVATPSGPKSIGVRPALDTNFWDGLIDDVRIYNRALSSSEISELAKGKPSTGSGLYLLGRDLDINGNLAIHSGEIDVSASNYGVTLAGDLLNVGEFTKRSGTFTLDGTTQTLSGSMVFHNLTKTVTSADTMWADFTGRLSVSGALTLQGASNQLLTLRSTKIGSGWTLHLDDAGTQSLQYVDAQDSDASEGARINCNTGCTDSGRNTNWNFGYRIVGKVSSDEGTTALTSKTVALSTNGGAVSQRDTTDAGGQYTMSGVVMTGGTILTLFLDGETQDAVTITLGSGSNMTGVHLYQDRLIVRSDSGSVALTNAHLANADNSGDSDITAILSTAASSAITVADGKELLIWTGDTFAPGGTVTVDDIDINGTFTMGANAVTVSGTWDATGGSFTGTNIVTFDSVSSETITSNNNAFSGVTFNGTNGVWDLSDQLRASGALTITAGTLDLNGKNLDLSGGSFGNNAGTLRLQGGETLTAFTNDSDSGTVEYDGTGTYASLAAGSDYVNLRFTHAGTFTIASNTTVAGNLIQSGGTLSFGTTTLTLDGTADQTLQVREGTNLFNLTLNNTGGGTSDDIVMSGGTLAISGALTITLGNLDLTTNSRAMIVERGITLADNAQSTLQTASNVTNSGGLTVNDAATITVTGGTWTLNDDGDENLDLDGQRLHGLTIANGGTVTVAANSELNLSGALTVNAGTIDLQANTERAAFEGLTIANGATFRTNSSVTASGTVSIGSTATLTMTGGTWTFSDDGIQVVNVNDQFLGNVSVNLIPVVSGEDILIAASAFAATGTLTVNRGELHLGGNTLTVSGAITIANDTTAGLIATGTVKTAGNITKGANGTLLMTGASLTFFGVSQTLNTGGPVDLLNLTIASPSSTTLGSDQTFFGTLQINTGATLKLSSYALGGTGATIINYASLNEGTGKLVHTGSLLYMANSSYLEVDDFKTGDTVWLTVRDTDENIVGTGKDTVSVVITGGTGDREMVTLTETDNTSGVFRGSIATAKATIATADGTIQTTSDTSLAYTFTDAQDSLVLSDAAVLTVAGTTTGGAAEEQGSGGGAGSRGGGAISLSPGERAMERGSEEHAAAPKKAPIVVKIEPISTPTTLTPSLSLEREREMQRLERLARTEDDQARIAREAEERLREDAQTARAEALKRLKEEREERIALRREIRQETRQERVENITEFILPELPIQPIVDYLAETREETAGAIGVIAGEMAEQLGRVPGVLKGVANTLARGMIAFNDTIDTGMDRIAESARYMALRVREPFNAEPAPLLPPPRTYPTQLTVEPKRMILAILHVEVYDKHGQTMRRTPVVLFSVPQIAVTDHEGVATFRDVEVGEHRLEIHKEGTIDKKQIIIEPPSWLTAREQADLEVTLPVVQVVLSEQTWFGFMQTDALVYLLIAIILLLLTEKFVHALRAVVRVLHIPSPWGPMAGVSRCRLPRTERVKRRRG